MGHKIVASAFLVLFVLGVTPAWAGTLKITTLQYKSPMTDTVRWSVYIVLGSDKQPGPVAVISFSCISDRTAPKVSFFLEEVLPEPLFTVATRIDKGTAHYERFRNELGKMGNLVSGSKEFIDRFAVGKAMLVQVLDANDGPHTYTADLTGLRSKLTHLKSCYSPPGE